MVHDSTMARKPSRIVREKLLGGAALSPNSFNSRDDERNLSKTESKLGVSSGKRMFPLGIAFYGQKSYGIGFNEFKRITNVLLFQ